MPIYSRVNFLTLVLCTDEYGRDKTRAVRLGF
jgi:hypothetical protein